MRCASTSCISRAMRVRSASRTVSATSACSRSAASACSCSVRRQLTTCADVEAGHRRCAVDERREHQARDHLPRRLVGRARRQVERDDDEQTGEEHTTGQHRPRPPAPRPHGHDGDQRRAEARAGHRQQRDDRARDAQRVTAAQREQRERHEAEHEVESDDGVRRVLLRLRQRAVQPLDGAAHPHAARRRRPRTRSAPPAATADSGGCSGSVGTSGAAGMASA